MNWTQTAEDKYINLDHIISVEYDLVDKDGEITQDYADTYGYLITLEDVNENPHDLGYILSESDTLRYITDVLNRNNVSCGIMDLDEYLSTVKKLISQEQEIDKCSGSKEIGHLKSGYICKDCAKKHGAELIEGHYYTGHEAYCNYCLQLKFLYHTSDWNWPKKRYLERNREL